MINYEQSLAFIKSNKYVLIKERLF